MHPLGIGDRVIKIQAADGRFAPVVICDVCGLPIDHARDGSCLWEPRTGPEPAPSTPLFVHKGCDAEGPRAEHHRYYSMPMEAFLVHLAENVNVPWGDPGAAATAESAEQA